jgi:D-alanyl-D-alanine carboxypeptidase-like protein
MAANNTSAFNCRAVTGGSAWSEHSYGWAIDVNPVQNPYVDSGGAVLPPEGSPFLDRSQKVEGLIHAGGTVVRAFEAIGWGWGGRWEDPVDYQHFSLTGR